MKRMNSSRRRPVQMFARALPFKVGKGSRARVSRRGLFKRSQRAPSRKRPVRGRREEARDVSREHGKALRSVVPNCLFGTSVARKTQWRGPLALQII